jgi:hypothetical protein
MEQDPNLMFSKDLEGKIDVGQFYENTVEDEPISLNIWVDNHIISSTVHMLKTSGSRMRLEFFIDKVGVSSFMFSPKVHKISFSNIGKENEIIDFSNIEVISKSFDLSGSDIYKCGLTIATAE